MPSESEVSFIRWWRANVGLFFEDAVRRPRTAPRLPEWDIEMRILKLETDPVRWVLTPRGADLIATADAIGFDPDAAPDPAQPVQCDPDARANYDDCPYCAGDACHRCGWARSDSTERPCSCDVIDRHEALRLPCFECGDTREVVVVGRFMEACRTCTPLRVSALTLATTERMSGDEHGEWITDQDRIRSTLEAAASEGHLVSIKHSGGGRLRQWREEFGDPGIPTHGLTIERVDTSDQTVRINGRNGRWMTLNPSNAGEWWPVVTAVRLLNGRPEQPARSFNLDPPGAVGRPERW